MKDAPTPATAIAGQANPALNGQVETPRSTRHTVVIEPRQDGRLVDLAELRAYRDLFRFLVWREIKVRYAQSAIGIGWAIIQPTFQMIVFVIVFNRLAGLATDGAPAPLWSFAALAPWTYFTNAMTDGVASLVANAAMIRKIYFPRMLMPLSAVAARGLDFVFASGLLAILMLAFGQAPNAGLLAIPLLVAIMVTAASGATLWLTPLAIQFRDVKHALTFFIQILLYSVPVVYSLDKIPSRFHLLYALNPMVGVIEGFRSALLGTRPMPWDLIAVGAATAVALLVSGMWYFRSRERLFADVA